MSPSDDWPSDPSALAAIAADTDRALGERQRAMTGLTHVVLTLARRALARYRGLLPIDDMIRSAPGEVWERLPGHFPSPLRPFDRWCLTVLRNWARDACRAASHDPLRGAVPVLPADAADEEETDDEPLRDTAVAIRAILEEARAADWCGRDVDFYAVFLSHLRLTLAARASDAYLAEGPAGAGQPTTLAADWAASLLPWHEAEGRRRFRPTWPELRRIWTAVRAALLQPPHRVEGGTFCGLVTDLLGGASQLTPDVWYQWVRRARDRAEALIAPAEWKDWFAPWLPTRRGRPASAVSHESGATS